MTRKRYVKLLMACGHSRNDAENWARNAREVLNRSYRADMESWERVYKDMAQASRIWWLRDFHLANVDILHRALYGEVAHE